MFCGLVVVLTLVVFISPVAAEPAVTIDGDQLVTVGNDIVLTCRFNASLSALEVQWKKDGLLIASNVSVKINDSRVTIRRNNTASQLNITNSTLQDTGNYTCLLGNYSAMAIHPLIVMQVKTTAAPKTTGSAPTTTGSTDRTTPGSTSSEIPATTPTDTPTTNPTEKTCAKLGVIINMTWDENFENKSSESYNAVTKEFSTALETLYNDSAKYGDVEVTEVALTQKDKMVLANAKLCLLFKGNDKDFIEDVFIEKVKSGKLSERLSVIKDSAEFKAEGVSFTDWKAKEGECKKKCDGAAGHFDIVGTCKPDKSSCKGLKNTKTSEDCPKYCPSSAAAITVSSLILAIGILLSFSFQ